MKIITGTAKGRRLVTLEGTDTRPTSERIKEAVFSALQFDLEGRIVLDLFAGSGQMGLEALSRGAGRAMFVDASAEAIAIVKTNAKATGFFEVGRYLISDYRNYIRKAAGRDVYDLVFIDPPYAMMCCTEAVRRLAEARLLARGAILVLECGAEGIRTEELKGFRVLKDKAYGRTTRIVILFYEGGENVCV